MRGEVRKQRANRASLRTDTSNSGWHLTLLIKIGIASIVG